MWHDQNRQFINKNGIPSKLKQQYSAMCLGLCLAPFSMSTLAAQTDADVENNYTNLSKITVYAENEDTVPASITKISRDNLDRTGATDMASIVKYLPLVSAPKSAAGSASAWDGTGTSGYNIRGVDGNRVGLDVDGVDLASVTTEPDGYKNNSYSSGRDFIDPEMFSDIVVSSGTTDGRTDGLGGRVSFKTKSPDDYLTADKHIAGRLKGGYSTADDAWFSSVTAALGNETLRGLIAYSHRNGHETSSNGTLKENPMDWSSDAILTRILWNFTKNQRLGFTFDYYKKDQDRFISTDELTGLYPQGATQSTSAERKRFTLDHLFTPEQFVLFDQLTSSFSYQDTQNNNKTYAFYRTGNGYRTMFNDYQEKNYQLRLDASKKIANNTISYGLGANRIESDRPWVQLNPNNTITTQHRMVNSQTEKYWLYAADKTTFDIGTGRLDIEPGLRFEMQRYKPKNTSEVLSNTEAQQKIQSKDNSYVAPNFALGYQWSPHYYTYMKYNRGERIPTAAEMAGTFSNTAGAISYTIVGNSELKEETSNAFEIGFKSTPFKGIKFNLTGFYTQYHNFIDYKQLDTPFAGQIMTFQLQNVANANIWGGELSTRLDLGSYFPRSEGYSLALVAGKTKGNAKNYDGTKTGINSVQPEKASFTFAYDDPNKVFGLGFTATAVGDRTATQDATFVYSSEKAQSYKRVPGYVVYDLSSYWNVNKFMTFNVSLNNLFDQKYWDYATVGTLTNNNLIDRATMPGRNVVASLEFKY